MLSVLEETPGGRRRDQLETSVQVETLTYEYECVPLITP